MKFGEHMQTTADINKNDLSGLLGGLSVIMYPIACPVVFIKW
jgi:hypothetical protein